jgi:hypothetical protein
MTRTEIKQAILDGKTVNWENGYTCIMHKWGDDAPDVFVKGDGGYMTYLQPEMEAACFIQAEPSDLFNRMGDIFRPEPAPIDRMYNSDEWVQAQRDERGIVDEPEPLEPLFGKQAVTRDTDYLETFYEVAVWIENQLHPDNRAASPLVKERYEQQGMGAKWELAEELTDRFQQQHEGVKWGEDENYPDWLEYLESWLHEEGQRTQEAEPVFFYKDKSGRGFTANLTLTDILEMPDEDNEDGEEPTLHEWAKDAEIGDVFRPDYANVFTRIS